MCLDKGCHAVANALEAAVRAEADAALHDALHEPADLTGIPDSTAGEEHLDHPRRARELDTPSRSLSAVARGPTIASQGTAAVEADDGGGAERLGSPSQARSKSPGGDGYGKRAAMPLVVAWRPPGVSIGSPTYVRSVSSLPLASRAKTPGRHRHRGSVVAEPPRREAVSLPGARVPVTRRCHSRAVPKV